MPQAFQAEEERILDYDHDRVSVSPYAYLKRGRYIEFVEMYSRYFGDESMKVILFEDLVASGHTVRDLCGFLRVEPDAISSSPPEVAARSGRAAAGLSPELQRYLVDYFAEANARLGERLGLDLSVWRSS
jgi:hypothetical protein